MVGEILCNIQILRTNLHPLFLSNEIKADSETVGRHEDSEMCALGKNRFVFIKKETKSICSVKVYLNLRQAVTRYEHTKEVKVVAISLNGGNLSGPLREKSVSQWSRLTW